MAAGKSTVLIVGSAAAGILLIGGFVMLMREPEARPRTPPAEAPAPAPKAAPVTAVQAPREAPTHDLENPDSPVNLPAQKRGTQTAQEQNNNETNAYTIRIRERLNELEYRRAIVSGQLPIEQARHEAIIRLYNEGMTRIQTGQAEDFSAEMKRLEAEEESILKGAKDAEISPSK